MEENVVLQVASLQVEGFRGCIRIDDLQAEGCKRCQRF